MAFVVYVKIPDEYEQLSIFDEYASSLCEDDDGQICGRAGKNEEYEFSVREDKKSKPPEPPGLITVTATIITTTDSGQTVKDTQTVKYPILKSGQHFEFPKPA
ncbi:hypothetical protein FHS26_005296 [Rhizobium pisi]|uniref:Uncharacterized protein n=1 Tax=Rhizobium pisi TaxID=574561 RepID=A0A3R8ZY75_9HYPH|nr:hypothetical protein [Rhizobium pisi]MBB3137534.1 hypothetical protein [Rhizobium pisi]RSB66353.1 hypothetical protein EFD55_24590 [Rhizobium pisi]TCA49708.1 hypothetical protein E0J16_23365 [Rhizobium pisi]